jgi:uncharacterized protein (TIGR03437 family)
VRISALVFLFVTAVYGQFGELATTDDGRQVYFTSTLKLPGMAPDFGEYRVYRAAEDGISLFAERGALTSENSFGSSDGARSPQVSSDGRTVGFTLIGICDGQTCGSARRAQLRGLHAGVLGEGSLFMSRNGKWALLVPQSGPRDPEPPADAALINLETGERASVPPPPFQAVYPLASDGAVIAVKQQPGGGSTVGLWREGVFAPLAASGPISPWGLSDNGRVLIYSGRDGLMARNLSTGADIVIARTARDEFARPMGVSNDGRLVLFRVLWRGLEGPAYIVNTETAQPVPVELPDGELATDGVLTGSGNAALLVTTQGRIARVEITPSGTGAVTTVVPATPYVRNLGRLTPGGLIDLEGALLPDTVEAASGRFTLDGRPLPVLSANRAAVRVQVPWEQTRSWQAKFHVDVPSESPFQQDQLVTVEELSPRFAELGPGETSSLGFKAVRGDFSGLLTEDPKPGEIFHLYMTGLGPVENQEQLQTAQPTPYPPLFPIRGAVQCRFFPYTADAETLFAGLAPGMLGIYQVTFKMPDGPSLGRITGGLCNLTGPNSSVNMSWARLGSN